MQTETVINVNKKKDEAKKVIQIGDKVRIENKTTNTVYNTIVSSIDGEDYLIDLDSAMHLLVLDHQLYIGGVIGAWTVTAVYKKCEISLEE